eukprot:12813113-Ditylum_brightwellii.AAC.1
MLKEFLDVCICLEEAEVHKPLAKKIACAKEEHNNDGKGKHHDKSKLCHKRHHSMGKCHVGKHKKKKHAQLTHYITEQQRLQQVWFIKDAEKRAKKCSLSAKKVKGLNMFIKDKINEMIKERNCDMHVMSDFKNLSLFSSNKSVQSIISNTSEEGSDNESCKPASKK